MSKAITLYQYPHPLAFPNFSPFCMKLETYLRLTHTEYQTVTIHNPRQSPLGGKLPFIKYGDELLGDSALIINRLEEDNIHSLNHHLNDVQRAEMLCVQRMLEDHFYWVIVFSRWMSKQGWPVWSLPMKKAMPPVIGGFILNRVKTMAKRQLLGQGIGRHTEENIFKMGISDLEALNTKMGSRAWYFNDQPSVLDAIIYGFLAACLSNPWPSPVKDFILNQRNMMQYLEQIHSQYFSEFPPIKE